MLDHFLDLASKGLTQNLLVKEEQNPTVACNSSLWIDKNYTEEYEEYQVGFSRSFLQIVSN